MAAQRMSGITEIFLSVSRVVGQMSSSSTRLDSICITYSSRVQVFCFVFYIIIFIYSFKFVYAKNILRYIMLIFLNGTWLDQDRENWLKLVSLLGRHVDMLKPSSVRISTTWLNSNNRELDIKKLSFLNLTKLKTDCDSMCFTIVRFLIYNCYGKYKIVAFFFPLKRGSRVVW